MTRIVRNNKTGAYVNVDCILNKAYEYPYTDQATIFNEEIDEMTDVDVLEYVTKAYGGEDVELEILPVNVTVDISALWVAT